MNKCPSNNDGDVKIEIKASAGTKIPAVLTLKFFKSSEPTKSSVKLWDMPGFGDNRGLTQILINTYFMHRIFALQ